MARQGVPPVVKGRMMSRHWTETDIPDLHGRTAVVTGASTGLGFEVARMLAGHGVTVIMACRNAGRAESAADRMIMSRPLRLLASRLLQSPQVGAPPAARAADPGVRGGEYDGPGDWNEWTGHPQLAQSIPRSHDAGAARRLWEVSEQLTAVTYDISARGGPAAVTNEADARPGAITPAAATLVSGRS